MTVRFKQTGADAKIHQRFHEFGSHCRVWFSFIHFHLFRFRFCNISCSKFFFEWLSLALANRQLLSASTTFSLFFVGHCAPSSSQTHFSLIISFLFPSSIICQTLATSCCICYKIFIRELFLWTKDVWWAHQRALCICLQDSVMFNYLFIFCLALHIYSATERIINQLEQQNHSSQKGIPHFDLNSQLGTNRYHEPLLFLLKFSSRKTPPPLDSHDRAIILELLNTTVVVL